MEKSNNIILIGAMNGKTYWPIISKNQKIKLLMKIFITKEICISDFIIGVRISCYIDQFHSFFFFLNVLSSELFEKAVESISDPLPVFYKRPLEINQFEL